MKTVLLLLMFSFLFSSCAFFDNSQEFAKTLWGSSTRALENARDNAVTKTYDKSYWDCIRNATTVAEKNKWTIFKKDEVKGYLVLMAIKGSVNTTEVGVFFTELSDVQTRVEISSLSTNAKRKVAKALFHGLDIAFGYLPPDPSDPKETDNKDTNQVQPAKL
ncbi:MAG: hypothetical protein HQL14_07660 [Candidatus Omnitrophica bacterium]|nr:hypothetical protein [Candidatus Omnitrophota bacterium]